jgi:hypothetical protein
MNRDELVANMVRAGELEVAGADPAEIAAYFDTENLRFHGPDGFESTLSSTWSISSASTPSAA